MTKHVNFPALQKSLPDTVAEYEEKKAAISEHIAAFKAAENALDAACTMGGHYVGGAFDRKAWVSKTHIERVLLESAWRHVYEGLNIHRIAPAKERRQFDLSLKTPPEFTIDNIRATFGKYITGQRFHILRGLAEAFCSLNPAFKSHSKVKIGVDGLPKRIILERVVGEYGITGYGADILKDVLNALFNSLGEEQLEYVEWSNWIKSAQEEPTDHRGFTLKVFKNGNGHLHFSNHRLVAINNALAEFYGDVLPDSPEAKREEDKTGTAVSKDLQFYPTPAPVAKRCLDDIYLKPGMKVLDPSCGEGALMLASLSEQPDISIVGIEYSARRAETARSKGLNVLTANFFSVAPNPVYDLVFMNPPFCGTHWKDHLKHAKGFVKPGGRLVCILPASAHVDGHLDEFRKTPGYERDWRDLPVGSFSESGTNIATGYYSWRKPEEQK